MSKDPLPESLNGPIHEFMEKWIDAVQKRIAEPRPDTCIKYGYFKTDGYRVVFVEDETGLEDEICVESSEESAARMTDLHNQFLKLKHDHNIEDMWPVAMESSYREVTTGPQTLQYDIHYLPLDAKAPGIPQE